MDLFHQCRSLACPRASFRRARSSLRRSSWRAARAAAAAAVIPAVMSGVDIVRETGKRGKHLPAGKRLPILRLWCAGCARGGGRGGRAARGLCHDRRRRRSGGRRGVRVLRGGHPGGRLPCGRTVSAPGAAAPDASWPGAFAAPPEHDHEAATIVIQAAAAPSPRKARADNPGRRVEKHKELCFIRWNLRARSSGHKRTRQGYSLARWNSSGSA